MYLKINCQHSDGGSGCQCEKIKRSFFGLGRRVCTEWLSSLERGYVPPCPYKKEYPPPQPLKRYGKP